MDFPFLLINTVMLRPYVFLFLLAFLYSAKHLLGWKRTGGFFFLTWATAFLCEFSSTRTGIPFGWYYYTGSTIGRELYIADVPFMDSLSFTFLLFASYCMALLFTLPSSLNPNTHRAWATPILQFDPNIRRSWYVVGLTCLFFALIDVVIDPVALRGDRWFLGQIYGYAEEGIYFGVPLANFLGWAIVGGIAMTAYIVVDRRLPEPIGSWPNPLATAQPPRMNATTVNVLLGVGLYYSVLLFNVGVTLWIGEFHLALTGIFIYIPVIILTLLRLGGWLAPTA